MYISRFKKSHPTYHQLLKCSLRKCVSHWNYQIGFDWHQVIVVSLPEKWPKFQFRKSSFQCAPHFSIRRISLKIHLWQKLCLPTYINDEEAFENCPSLLSSRKRKCTTFDPCIDVANFLNPPTTEQKTSWTFSSTEMNFQSAQKTYYVCCPNIVHWWDGNCAT